MVDDLVKRREELLVKLRVKKVELKEKAKEKKLLEEIKVLEKALKNPNTLDKINFALKNGKSVSYTHLTLPTILLV